MAGVELAAALQPSRVDVGEEELAEIDLPRACRSIDASRPNKAVKPGDDRRDADDCGSRAQGRDQLCHGSAVYKAGGQSSKQEEGGALGLALKAVFVRWSR